jgi:hypothetical protein
VAVLTGPPMNTGVSPSLAAVSGVASRSSRQRRAIGSRPMRPPPNRSARWRACSRTPRRTPAPASAVRLPAPAWPARSGSIAYRCTWSGAACGSGSGAARAPARGAAPHDSGGCVTLSGSACTPASVAVRSRLFPTTAFHGASKQRAVAGLPSWPAAGPPLGVAHLLRGRGRAVTHCWLGRPATKHPSGTVAQPGWH